MMTSAERELRNLRRDLTAALVAGDDHDVALCRMAIARQEQIVAANRALLLRTRQPGETLCPADMEAEDEE